MIFMIISILPKDTRKLRDYRFTPDPFLPWDLGIVGVVYWEKIALIIWKQV